MTARFRGQGVARAEYEGLDHAASLACQIAWPHGKYCRARCGCVYRAVVFEGRGIDFVSLCEVHARALSAMRGEGAAPV